MDAEDKTRIWGTNKRPVWAALRPTNVEGGHSISLCTLQRRRRNEKCGRKTQVRKSTYKWRISMTC
jgi:hypothetical protein